MSRWYLASIIVSAIIGHYIYGGSGAMAILVLGVLYYLATWLNLIPFIGIIIQGLVIYYWIFPYVNQVWGIAPTLLTAVMFVISIVYGLYTNYCSITELWKIL